ncbi:UDP-N-acetylmuramoyl-tripeptide--D-alanyl-D-alanine ligase [Noviherbaspirillum pedocola]|uniref:UDP-N-acetylmuramoyl-tripeptide--D-alanyl-D-alanine ligase n=1 Tax=Noviherbaspirillum pedocola TaxID=2801341 RepID=A0A934SQB4_9BURK|nr:UDP-N-acetylmuramoyl-tripeptide--D-alanyl-D-alanine ligase [Noviherbaspirillum pedocola]MBK4733552.1 UDP-N-acetylmuramoyl-tripeptide--D-alanyl-D-alanine ligase [Noviherbaspirillum pedocola]
MKSSLTQLLPRLTGATMSAAAAFDGVSTDSKTVAPGNLFVALRGERFDAHDFLADVAAKGAAAVVVERMPPGLNLPALIVPDTRVALGEIAAHWRRQFDVPVIGVTGSNGKTTVKEMIAAILAAEFGADNILATRGNLNNDIGVPLTVLRMDARHRAAVIELGMNHPGEIAQLAAIAQPTVAHVNNAQREHQEFMATVEAVAQENGSVISALPDGGIAVYPADDVYTPLWRGLAKASGQRKSLTFGLSLDANVGCSYVPQAFGSTMTVRVGQREFEVNLQAAGAHNVRNALAAIACTLAIGVHRRAIVQGLENFAPVHGRLQRKQASSGATVIDDTYNANPDSVKAAIDVLAMAASPRVLVLGDMGEVGSEGRKFHEEVGAYAKGRGIEHLLTLGELAESASHAFGARAKHFGGIDELAAYASELAKPAATLLVKGSRFMRMERVVQHLVGAPAASSAEAH